MKGINLIWNGKNSASKKDTWVINWNKELFQVSTPNPKNKSLANLMCIYLKITFKQKLHLATGDHKKVFSI